MEREGGVVGRLLGARRARQAASRRCGRAGPRTSRSPARCSTSHRADRPLALRRGAGARGRLRGADLARPAPGLAARRRSRRPTVDGRARSSAASATSTRASGCRSCSRRSRASARERPDARLLLVGAASPRLRPRPAAAAARPRRRRRRARGRTSTRTRLWALMAACDVCVNLRSPTMGETSGTRDPRALARQAAVVVSDVGWFAELPDDVALKVPVDEREVETLAGRARAARAAAGRARRDGRGARASSPGASTTSTASPTATSPRSSRRPAARRSRDAVLGEVARGRGRGRDRARLARGAPSSARPRSPRSSSVGDRLRAVPAWAWLARDRHRLVPRSGPGSRAAMLGAVHHGRRADLLGAGEELRRRAAASGPRRPGDAATASSTRS